MGRHVNVSHEAATPSGLEITARVKLVEVDGRRLAFDVEASDGVDIISRGAMSSSTPSEGKAQGRGGVHGKLLGMSSENGREQLSFTT